MLLLLLVMMLMMLMMTWGINHCAVVEYVSLDLRISTLCSEKDLD